MVLRTVYGESDAADAGLAPAALHLAGGVIQEWTASFQRQGISPAGSHASGVFRVSAVRLRDGLSHDGSPCYIAERDGWHLEQQFYEESPSVHLFCGHGDESHLRCGEQPLPFAHGGL